jgi:transcriptional regulator of acetoin/glycerol metabolism
LRAALRRAAILAEMPKIGSADLALPLAEERGSLLLDEVRERAEREAIRAALERTGGNMQRAAKELGIARGTLYRIIERHDIMAPVRPRATTPGSKLQKLN